MPEQFRNHAEEIAAALRPNAASPCCPHARTLAGQPQAASPRQRPTDKPKPAPGLHFARSVFALHLDRLYRATNLPGIDTEQGDEIMTALQAVVQEAVTRYTAELTEDDMERLSMRLDYSALSDFVNWVGVAQHVSPHAVAQHIDRAALALALESSVAKRIDLTDLAAVMMPLVLPEIERQARAVVAAERAQAEEPAFDSAEALERRTIDRVMELRGALERLLELDLADMKGRASSRDFWDADYRAAVERAEKALGRVPAAVDKHE